MGQPIGYFVSETNRVSINFQNNYGAYFEHLDAYQKLILMKILIEDLLEYLSKDEEYQHLLREIDFDAYLGWYSYDEQINAIQAICDNWSL